MGKYYCGIGSADPCNPRRYTLSLSTYFYRQWLSLKNCKWWYLHMVMGYSVTFQYSYAMCADLFRMVNISCSCPFLHDWRLGTFCSVCTVSARLLWTPHYAILHTRNLFLQLNSMCYSRSELPLSHLPLQPLKITICIHTGCFVF